MNVTSCEHISWKNEHMTVEIRSVCYCCRCRTVRVCTYFILSH